ncbi:hypothetical protein EWM64_g5647 [Hericium alpestre]|uniref:Aminopeptidase P N-terminal domain-containing protein n=1 Tax=Hericium alpestre TaxID=135208 RepID=A0A4Y9ZUV4_9AGAM|nr:hypothetical protein EWM64_g5647 [Hericium alpestre]
MIASRDTTACLLTYVVYLLAMHPDVMHRLRDEVLDTCGQTGTPTSDSFREMKYLRAVLNETLRVFPPVPLNVRESRAEPCVFPPGDPTYSNAGPLFVPGGTPIMYFPMLIQRSMTLWGSDADVFDPERWLDPERVARYTANPLMFQPFSAGPRIEFDSVSLAPDAQPESTLPPETWKTGRGRQKVEKIWPSAAMTLFVKFQASTDLHVRQDLFKMVYPAQEHASKTLQKLAELLPAEERVKPQIILVAGALTPFRNDTDRELPFRQESNFNYLTGCTVPSSLALLVASSATSASPTFSLFIPPIEPVDLMWSVPPPTLEAARETHDATTVAHTTDFSNAIVTALAAHPNAVLHTLPGTPEFPTLPAQYADLVQSSPNMTRTDVYLLPALHRARLIKTPAEIDRIRKANQISSRAHEVVMRVLGNGVRGLKKEPGAGVDRPLLPGEWLIEKEAEAEAIFVASCRREGAVHQAYLPIVAASNRASTLHYCCNDREFAWGPVKPHDHENRNAFANGGPRDLLPQVLLIDAGSEWDCYASDITRTMPVGNGGKFTPEAREIYSLVLEMQKLSLDILKPSLHWDAVQLLCHRTLVRGFQRLGIFKNPNSPGSGSWNSEEAILASGVSAAFFPHGVGHSLGMDVHDVPSASKPAVNPTTGKGLELGNEAFYTYLRLRLPLEEGMVVTVEPGIYFHPHLLAPVRDSKHIDHEMLKRYESVGGVRIEDVILITKDRYENLTTVRSDVDWVEGVCSGKL